MVILDTHVWIWWVDNPSQLSTAAKKLVDKAKTSNAIYISSISVWEIAMLVKNERLFLTVPLDEWIYKCEKLQYINFVPVDNRIAEHSVNLPGEFHKDPADRIIVATARQLNINLITKDDKIHNYKYVKSRW